MIYAILANVVDYLNFVLDSKETRNKLGKSTQFHFNPSPISYADVWQPIDIDFAKLSGGAKGGMPDITLRNGRLFLNQTAFESLYSVLEKHGELLPVLYQDKTGYLFNPLSLAESVEGVDQKLSTRDHYGELQSLAFHEERVKDFAVFRTAFDNYQGVYCSSAFKQLVEEAGLKGIVFNSDLGNLFASDPSAQQPTLH
ncbi:imm11 family protein [Pleionea sp. CnH1-48]|uniref:imm11 family protein n=1 Tax=Pleionea sp. CnH1-48 TaxID=2954494 RepID=UPI0020974762|nr:DUF1629 domain-containing protein [Pleionea sp. CnH1-48]MCO7223303.1 hypothetical protein [Pleionea sp. CnH1-48]